MNMIPLDVKINTIGSGEIEQAIGLLSDLTGKKLIFAQDQDNLGF